MNLSVCAALQNGRPGADEVKRLDRFQAEVESVSQQVQASKAENVQASLMHCL